VSEVNGILLKLRRLLRSRGRSPDDTDDLIQEAFLRLQVYCREHTVRQTEAFLVRTALNLSADQGKAERVRAVVPDGLYELLLVDPKPLPDEVCAAQQRLQRMKRGLEAMPPRRREVFVMNRIDGYSFPQIAEQLGITVSAVEKNAAKAALFLTDWMDDDED
jgi:RNA polymerase sigma factor (sigma-70 family)